MHFDTVSEWRHIGEAAAMSIAITSLMLSALSLYFLISQSEALKGEIVEEKTDEQGIEHLQDEILILKVAGAVSLFISAVAGLIALLL